MRHNILIRLVIVFTVAFAGALSSQATLRTFNFNGVLTIINDPLFQFDSSVTNGAPFEGTYSFDDAATDSSPDTTVGHYRARSGPSSITVKVGSYVFRSRTENFDLLVETVDRPDGDHFFVISYENVASSGMPLDHIWFWLDDPSGAVNSNDLLPTQTPDLSAYSRKHFRIAGQYSNDFMIDGEITSVRAAPRSFSFRGQVEDFHDTFSQLPAALTNGTPFEGFYVFDPGTPDTNPETFAGAYWHTNGPAGITVKVGPYVFQTNPEHVNFLVEVARAHGIDNYLLRSYNNRSSIGVPVQHISWQLDDPTGTALNATGDSLPFFPPNLNAFQSVFGVKIRGAGNGFHIQGRITAIEETALGLPNPPAISLAEAVEVSFPTKLGYLYQVKYSHDFQTWTNTGAPVLGNGESMSVFVRKPAGPLTFYRAEIAQ